MGSGTRRRIPTRPSVSKPSAHTHTASCQTVADSIDLCIYSFVSGMFAARMELACLIVYNADKFVNAKKAVE